MMVAVRTGDRDGEGAGQAEVVGVRLLRLVAEEVRAQEQLLHAGGTPPDQRHSLEQPLGEAVLIAMP